MGTMKDVSVNSYCDAVNNELSGIKTRIDALRKEVEKTYGTEIEPYRAHARHLSELADFIDWKLQLLTKACPFDWKGMDKDVESTVSVGPAEKAPEIELSGGYLGG